MRKILSIVIALGLILSLSAMAVPTAGATCKASVSLSNSCASATSVVYTIATNATGLPTTLLVGDLLSVEFAAGTTFATFAAGDILVGGVPVTPITAVVKTGTKLVFPTPSQINAGTPFTIEIAKVKNPATPGTYSLSLDYKQTCCDAVVFDCAPYKITPKYCTYDFVWDSRPTYPGLALNFTPPFKACGQETIDGGVAGFNIGSGLTVKWLNLVDFLLMPVVSGCSSPCATDNISITLNLTAAPAGSNVTISLNSTVYDPLKTINLVPTAANPQPLVHIEPYAGTNYSLPDCGVTLNWTSAIHFDKVGSYQLCFKAWCPGDYTCPECEEGPILLADECFDIEVYQWKEACKIDFNRKWNLISLPLVPLEEGMSIEDLLAAHPKPSEFKSIHYYDRCADAWTVWGNGQTSLSTLEDGKGYWVKVDYALGSATKYPGAAIDGLWVWGNTKPVPPAGPSAYPVCDGWNMIGFTEGCSATMDDDDYLWNFNVSLLGPTYGAVYGWDALNQEWETPATPTTVLMAAGKGYWVSFGGNGMVYPP